VNLKYKVLQVLAASECTEQSTDDALTLARVPHFTVINVDMDVLHEPKRLKSVQVVGPRARALHSDMVNIAWAGDPRCRGHKVEFAHGGQDWPSVATDLATCQQDTGSAGP
jgi:hypothetical protein